MLAKDGLKILLSSFSIDPDSDPGLKLQTYLSLLEKWNPRVNLTANISWNALEPLFREGIWAASKYPSVCKTHLDIGSGAGFPAIILRVFNNVEMELVESRGKKGAFLETAAWEMGLTGMRVHTKRLEDLLTLRGESVGKMSWDCVSWKAVRLATQDLMRLHDLAGENTHFWMFHGKEPAVEDIRVLDACFMASDKLPVPEQKESFLSIYSRMA